MAGKNGGARPGAGRKKGVATLAKEKGRALIAKMLEENLEPIVLVAIQQAISGDKHARDWLTDNGYGKPSQSIDHTTLGKEMPQPIMPLPSHVPSDDSNS